MFQSVCPVLTVEDEKRAEEATKILQQVVDARAAGKLDNMSVETVKSAAIKLKKLSRGDILFRQHMIVLLISRYDEFLAETFSVVLRQHPAWLKGSEKTITYKRLYSR